MKNRFPCNYIYGDLRDGSFAMANALVEPVAMAFDKVFILPSTNALHFEQMDADELESHIDSRPTFLYIFWLGRCSYCKS